MSKSTEDAKLLARMFLAAAVHFGRCVCGAEAEEIEVDGERVFRMQHREDCPVVTSKIVKDVSEEGES